MLGWILFYLYFAQGFALKHRLLANTPDISDVYIYGDMNPYLNDTYMDMMFQSETSTRLNVINLDGEKITELSNVHIECYDAENCDNTLDAKEIELLSLYASMIETCATYYVPDDYSIGVLRDKRHESVIGRYTKTYTEDGFQITFWIRLSKGHGPSKTYIYHDLTGYTLTFAILELAAHERAHYEVTTFYDPTEGHCNAYQAVYNSLITHSIRNIEDFKIMMDHFVLGTTIYNQNTTTNIIIIVGITIAISIVLYYTWSFCKTKTTREKRIGLLDKV